MQISLIADAGIPMIYLQWPWMFYALIPVVVIEALVFRRSLAIKYRSAVLGSFLANLVSTAAGFPLAWGICFALELGSMSFFAHLPHGWVEYVRSSPIILIILCPLGTAWLNPLTPRYYWQIGFAAAVLLVPSFFVSVWLEGIIYRHFWRDLSPASVRRGTHAANLLSYALLLLVAAACTIYVYSVSRNAPNTF